MPIASSPLKHIFVHHLRAHHCKNRRFPFFFCNLLIIFADCCVAQLDHFFLSPPLSNEFLEPAPPLPPFKVDEDGNDSDGGDSDGDGDGVGDDAATETDGDDVDDDDSNISSMGIGGGERSGRQTT